MVPCQRWGRQRRRTLQLGGWDWHAASHWASCRCSRWPALALSVSTASFCLHPSVIPLPVKPTVSVLAHPELWQEAS